MFKWIVSRENTHKKRVCIVVPVYRISLYDYEIASFSQCLKIFNKYDIHIITYQQLPIERFLNQFSTTKNNIYIDHFSYHFFSNGIYGYNKLLLSPNFYRRFQEYEYMLIYQLDAYVFRDELNYWCNRGFDYIGSPWIDEETKVFKGVGNGGFSLRKISYYISVLSRRLPLIKPNLKCGSKRKILSDLVGIHNTVKYYVREWEPNEDGFLSDFLKNAYHAPKIPEPEEAVYFSFEKKPSYLYKMIGGQLPFGCHAFDRNEFKEFWFKYIDIKKADI